MYSARAVRPETTPPKRTISLRLRRPHSGAGMAGTPEHARHPAQILEGASLQNHPAIRGTATLAH